MERSTQETIADRTTANFGRKRTSALGGLPRPVLAGILVGVSAAVGLGGLARAGALAPQFRNTGGGELPGGASPVGFQVLRNVSWRSWKITVVEGPDRPGGKIVAFVKPADAPGALPEQVMTAAGNPTLTRLPLTVAAGEELVVFQYQKATACAPPASGSAGPERTRASVGIVTPLGQRWIRTTLFPGAPSSSSCAAVAGRDPGP